MGGEGFVGKLFHACLLVLGAMVALSLAMDILRCYWPWLAGVAGVVLGIWAVVWLVRSRRNRW